MARKSVIAGEYIIEIADNGHVDVLRVYSNAIEAMRDIAKEKNFPVDEKWNTQDFGRKLVKEFGDGKEAHFGDVVVKRLPTQKIEIYKECGHGNVRKELCLISEKMGFPYEKSWNTQTLGSKLVDYLLEHKEKADKVLQTPRGSRTSDAAAADPSSSVIKVTVDREKSETLDLSVTATGEVTIEGVEEPMQADGKSHKYTLTADEVVIRGAVTNFRCGSWSTGVTHLDLSGCPTLTSLDCRGLLVEELDLSKCVNLTELSLESCDELASLDLSKLVNLTKLSLKSCDQLPSLDLSKLVNLTELSLDPFDKFTSLDLSKFVNLTKLSLSSCGQLASLDLSKLVNLTDLSLSSCDQLTSLDLTKCVNLTRLYLDPNSSFFGEPDVQLTSLDLSKLVNLTDLSINTCDKLTSLDLSKLVNLTDLSISSCDQLTSLDLSKLVNLTKLSIESCSQLTSLDLSKLVNLTKLSLWSCSQLPNLDLSKCVKLTDFDCRGFELLPSLDLSQCVNLTDISLGESSQLTSLDLSKLVNLTSVRFWSCDRLASVDLSGSKELNSLNVSYCDSLEIIRCHTEAVPNLNLKAIKLPTVKEEGDVTLLMSKKFAEKGQADSSSPVIKLTVDREKKNTLRLTVIAPGEVTIEGVAEPFYAYDGSYDYTLTADEVVIRGAVTDFKCGALFTGVTHLDLSGCPTLTSIDCKGLLVEELDFSKLVNLTKLSIRRCKQLVSLDFSGSKQLSSLEVSGCDSLEIIRCHTEAVPNLDLDCIELPTVKEEGNVTLIMSEEYAEKEQADSQEITEVIQADPDDCPYELMIYTDGMPIRATEFFTFDERTDEVDEIEELIKSGNKMTLWGNYYGEGKLFAILDLWGDDQGVGYKVTDEDENVVSEGHLDIPEDAVCDFGYIDSYITKENHPKYILIRREYRRGSTSYYKIPRDLNLQKCTFPSIRAFESFSLINLDWEGDTMTGIEYGIRCDNVEYLSFYSEFDDGDSDFALYEYDEDKGRYMEVATTICDEE